MRGSTRNSITKILIPTYKSASSADYTPSFVPAFPFLMFPALIFIQPTPATLVFALTSSAWISYLVVTFVLRCALIEGQADVLFVLPLGFLWFQSLDRTWVLHAC